MLAASGGTGCFLAFSQHWYRLVGLLTAFVRRVNLFLYLKIALNGGVL